MVVTSVSRQEERLARAAASIAIISSSDIRRSGARTLPEALRLAPNLQVARVDARNYAITARGFNSPFENKLLVLIDGRSVYSPLFSGVFWDAQDLVMDDIERIEVISGPGSTIWGANAVNGVINVITKSAKDTQGARAAVVAGADERAATARYGASAGAHASYRAVRQVPGDRRYPERRRRQHPHRLRPAPGGLSRRLGPRRRAARRCPATPTRARWRRPARATSASAAPT